MLLVSRMHCGMPSSVALRIGAEYIALCAAAHTILIFMELDTSQSKLIALDSRDIHGRPEVISIAGRTDDVSHVRAELSSDHAEQQHHDSDHQQNVDETAHSVGGD